MVGGERGVLLAAAVVVRAIRSNAGHAGVAEAEFLVKSIVTTGGLSIER